jgi:hypothetical protein
MVFAVRPEVLHRVQFRRVGRQVLRLQTPFLVADELLCDATAVGWEPIPNQQNVAMDITEQVLEELDDLLGLDGVLEDLKVKVPNGQPGDDGQSLPVEVKLEDGRLPARCPCTPPVGPLAETTFVDEDDRAPLFLSFFLIAGQRLRFQSSINPSLRSNARPTGNWTLQFNCRRMRQTWPG